MEISDLLELLNELVGEHKLNIVVVIDSRLDNFLGLFYLFGFALG